MPVLGGPVTELLTRLHARACRVGSEVLVLLESGHAGGAHARWRTLHEIAVVALFLRDRGKDIANAYLLHDGIVSYRAARQAEEKKIETVAPHEILRLRQRYELLVGRFGKPYAEEYGWAAAVLGRERPTFADIEASSVGLDATRPYYRLASHDVHAGPKSIYFNMGVLGRQNVLAAGPSNAGLADPGHGMAISLGQVTAALLNSHVDLDGVMSLTLMTDLMDEIGQAFLEVHKRMEAEL